MLLRFRRRALMAPQDASADRRLPAHPRRRSPRGASAPRGCGERRAARARRRSALRTRARSREKKREKSSRCQRSARPRLGAPPAPPAHGPLGFPKATPPRSTGRIFTSKGEGRGGILSRRGGGGKDLGAREGDLGLRAVVHDADQGERVGRGGDDPKPDEGGDDDGDADAGGGGGDGDRE